MAQDDGNSVEQKTVEEAGAKEEVGKRKREVEYLIVICSDSDSEIAAARRGLELAEVPSFELQVEASSPSDSEVREIPISLEEIMEGAKNRAQNAWTRSKLGRGGADLRTWLGIQVGMLEVGGKSMELVGCAMFDGKFYHCGLSSAFELPRQVAREMTTGVSRREAFEDAGVPAASAGQGVLSWLSNGTASRSMQIAQAVSLAILPLRNFGMFTRMEGKHSAAKTAREEEERQAEEDARKAHSEARGPTA